MFFRQQILIMFPTIYFWPGQSKSASLPRSVRWAVSQLNFFSGFYTTPKDPTKSPGGKETWSFPKTTMLSPSGVEPAQPSTREWPKTKGERRIQLNGRPMCSSSHTWSWRWVQQNQTNGNHIAENYGDAAKADISSNRITKGNNSLNKVNISDELLGRVVKHV